MLIVVHVTIILLAWTLCEKCPSTEKTEKTPYLDTFHTVVSIFSLL